MTPSEFARLAAEALLAEHGAERPVCAQDRAAPGRRTRRNSTTDVQTDVQKCTCVDREGALKQLYRSRSEADRHCRIAFAERRVTLSVYPCPTARGWHLTSRGQ